MSHFLIYADGGARGNPGPAAIGVVIADKNGKVIEEISEYIGTTTNNQAEYQAVIAGLAKVILENRQDEDLSVICFLDSQLISEQLSGRYKIKNEGLKPLFWQTRELILRLKGRIDFQYIPRSQNKRADQLVNLALNKQNAKTN